MLKMKEFKFNIQFVKFYLFGISCGSDNYGIQHQRSYVHWY